MTDSADPEKTWDVASAELDHSRDFTDEEWMPQHDDDESPRPMFVAVLDVLGFKARIDNTPLAYLVPQYLQLLDLKRWSATIPVVTPGGTSYLRTPTTVFSDTIVLWGNDNKDALDTFLTAASVLMAQAIDSGWPLRGGIAYGEAVMSTRKRMFVGRAIVDAYLMEQCQQWVGVALHPTCLAHPTLSEWLTRHDEVIRYPVPTGRKRGRLKSEYAVHWGPRSHRGRTSLEDLKSGTQDRKSQRKYSSALRYLERKCRNCRAWSL